MNFEQILKTLSYKLIFYFFKFYYLELLRTQQKYIFSSGSLNINFANFVKLK